MGCQLCWASFRFLASGPGAGFQFLGRDFIGFWLLGRVQAGFLVNCEDQRKYLAENKIDEIEYAIKFRLQK